MFLDIKLGILWAFLVGVLFQRELTPLWFGAGVLFALLPDLDFWIEYAKRGTVGGTILGAHRVLLHNPLPYILVAVLLFFAAGGAWAMLFALGVFGHFIHDSLGMGFGVRWLWPFSGKFYKIFSDKAGNIYYDLAHLHPISWTHQEAVVLIEKKGNDRWLTEDVQYHLRHLPQHAFTFLVFGLTLYLIVQWLERYL